MKKAARIFALALICVLGVANAYAQFPDIQHFRYYDKNGINVFETPKNDTVKYTGLKLRIGGGFTQQLQSLSHENNATFKPDTVKGKIYDLNKLVDIIAGFNTAEANLMFDVQLADGVRLNLTTYLSARHHNETWVKGGYIQFDKMPFIKSELIDDIMKYITIKVGHMEINYGDAHFRRSDGGLTAYNPFIENYLLDAFTTEIGADVTFQSNGILAVAGITNGEIKGNVDPISATSADNDTTKSLAFYCKLGYDNKFSDNMRLRITGSGYFDNNSLSNTLFWGDRTGSHYFLVMEPQSPDAANPATRPSPTSLAWSGRINPKLSSKIQALQFNMLFQFSGLDIFATYETASGRTATETVDRKINQIAVDGIYRFDFGLFAGARYNIFTGRLSELPNADVSVNRIAAVAGWFLTDNIMLKAEYVTQTYKDFPTTDIRSGGKFNGLVAEAAVSF
jgi:hypothetical protein